MVFIIDSIDEGIARCELQDGSSFSVPAALMGDVREGDCIRTVPGGDIAVVSVKDEHMTVKRGGIYAVMPLADGMTTGDGFSFITDEEEKEARKKIIAALSEDLFE